MEIINLDLIHYDQALEMQLEKVSSVYNGGQECLLACRHHPVVTSGRQTEDGDITEWDGHIVPVSRGGRATYHGPGQVVIYPIVDLRKRNRDIIKFLRNCEKAIIETLTHYGVSGVGGEERPTGVWVGGKKVASIGLAVKRWITYHGMAVNIHRDPLAFQGISPCGMSSETMTDLESLIEKQMSWPEFTQILTKNLVSTL